MREQLMLIWRRITTIKFLFPVVLLIRYFAASSIFNELLDFIEVYILKTKYDREKAYFLCHKDVIMEINSYLGDEKSRHVYLNIWKYRISHKRKYIHGLRDKNQYFDTELIKLGEKECYVDCGAYRGDTVGEFIKRVPDGKYVYIFAFEPDLYNYRKLQDYVKRNGLKDIYCINKGTWDTEGKIGFLGNTEEACRISEENSNTVISTVTIDKVAGGRRVTFIKMDVEGAELRSLKGAEKIIERDHPRLAVSIYHSPEDMVDIIRYMKRRYPFYTLYVRHYTSFYADTVMYAIDEKADKI